MHPRLRLPFLALIATASTGASFAADIVLTPPAAGGVAVTNAAGNTTRFRVGDDGTIAFPALGIVPGTFTGLCLEVATGKIGTCASGGTGTVTSVVAGTGLTGGTITASGTIGLAATQLLPTAACTANQVPKWSGAAWACGNDNSNAGTITSVTASAPLASTGGNTPNLSLTGTVPVANGGTGQSSLATNGIVYGQGSGAVATAVGTAGQVLTGSAGAPAWTSSPSLAGNLTLDISSGSTVGNIMKGANSFIHNFGASNTFVGLNAGNFTLTSFALNGSYNTALGELALNALTLGSHNTAGGEGSMKSTAGGSNNTAWGRSTLRANTGGNHNVAVGANALANSVVGTANVAVGSSALSNATGSSNIALGESAGFLLTSGNFNIDIGNQGVAGESATIRIGDSNQTRSFISGISGVTSSGGVAVFVNASGQLGTLTSSGRFKNDVTDMEDASGDLMRLRPVTFHYKPEVDDGTQVLQYGLVAEEVAEVYPGLVARSPDGAIETVRYQFLPPMLLNEVQKQQRTIESQRKEIAGLRAEMDDLRRVLGLAR